MIKRGKMQKKSQSGIITTILIILVVLVAIVIVWNVVSGMIKRGTEQASTSPLDISLTTWKTDLSLSLVNYTNISVSRQAGAGNISAIIIIFKNSAGAEVCRYENKTDLPSELETKVYVVNLTNCSGRYSYDVYPVIKSGSKEIIGLKAAIEGGGTVTPPVAGKIVYYRDVDGDKYGTGASQEFEEGKNTTGYVKLGDLLSISGDCNDSNNTIWLSLQGYVDIDTDNYGKVGSTQQNLCTNGSLPIGYSSDNTDCNDNAPLVHPLAPETRFDGIDQDCDGYDNLNACGNITIGNVMYKLGNDLSVGVEETCFNIENIKNITLDLGSNTLTGQSGIKFWNCWDNMAGANCSQHTDYNSCNNAGMTCGYNSSCVLIGEDKTKCNNSGCYWALKCWPDALDIASIYGVNVRYSDNITIKNGNMETFSYGVYLYLTNNSIIEGISSRGYNNSYGSFSGYGIYSQYSSKNQINQLTSSNSAYGIYFYRGQNNTVSNSILNRNSYGARLYYSDNNAFSGNEIKSNLAMGVYNYRANNTVFVNNNVCGNTDGSGTDYDFYCYGSTGLSFTSTKCSNITGCTGLTCSAC